MQTNTVQRRWMNYDEASAYIGASRRQLQRWVQGDRVPYTKLGQQVLFEQKELDAFVEANTHRPAVSA